MAEESGIPRKRFAFVADRMNLNFDDISSSSSDSEEGSTNYKPKVRSNCNVKQLTKKRKKFVVDKEDSYASVKLQVTGKIKNCNSIKNSARKRRKISSESDGNLSKDRSLSRNAINARLNRERKKEYVKSIEIENESLKNDNSELKKINESQSKTIFQLKHEISYLRNVLANSKELRIILESIKSTGLQVSSRCISSDSKRLDEFEYQNDPEEEIRKMFCEDEVCSSTCSTKFGENYPIIDENVNLGKIENDFKLSDLENLSDNEKNDFFSKNFLSEEFSDKFLDSDNFNFAEPDKGSKGGICLHVNNKSISIEFCRICNENST